MWLILFLQRSVEATTSSIEGPIGGKQEKQKSSSLSRSCFFDVSHDCRNGGLRRARIELRRKLRVLCYSKYEFGLFGCRNTNTSKTKLSG